MTPNLDILRRFTADAESRELILAASHRVADGTPIVWASRLAGAPVPERVPGSDLVLSLPEAAAKAGVRVFLLGGDPGVAAAAARRLEDLYPGARHRGLLLPALGIRARFRGASSDQGGYPRGEPRAGPDRTRLSEAGES